MPPANSAIIREQVHLGFTTGSNPARSPEIGGTAAKIAGFSLVNNDEQ
jgi:hypothetical protein